MVMAARAGERNPKNAFRERIDLLVIHVKKQLLLILLGQSLLAERQKTGCNQTAAVDGARLIGGLVCGPIGGEQVARDLFAHEAVEGNIAIEALDDVIAVLIGIRVTMVLIVPGGIGISRHVQPVAAPLLAIARRGQQLVDYLLVSL